MSSSFAQKVHSITFRDPTFGEERNTWDNWHLVPTSRPVINPPSVHTHYIDIPGADGFIDLTDTLTGGPTFGDRTGSIEFMIINDYDVSSLGVTPILDPDDHPIWYNFNRIYSEIMAYLHGKRRLLSLDDDPDHFYSGRLSVNSIKSDQDRSIITIDYKLSPYRYKEVMKLSANYFEGPWRAIDSNGNDIDSNSQYMRTKERNSEPLDLSGAMLSNFTVWGTNNPTWKKSNRSSNDASMVIPLENTGISQLKITPNGYKDCVIAFLNSFALSGEDQVVEGDPVDLSTGYDARISLSSSDGTNTYDISAENNMNYLYVLRYDSSGNDRIPVIEAVYDTSEYIFECQAGDSIIVHADKMGTGSEQNPYIFGAYIHVYNMNHAHIDTVHYPSTRTGLTNEYKFKVDGYFRICTISFTPLENYGPSTVPTRSQIISHIAKSFTVYKIGDKF